jgi:HEAT repeat protein
MLTALAAGCGKDAQPLMSHGKPVSHWVEALKDSDPAQRKKAVKALAAVGTAASEALPALMGAVKDEDPSVRDEAVLALLRLGPDARDAIPVLEAAQDDPDPTVQSHVRKALERIRGE